MMHHVLLIDGGAAPEWYFRVRSTSVRKTLRVLRSSSDNNYSNAMDREIRVCAVTFFWVSLGTLRMTPANRHLVHKLSSPSAIDGPMDSFPIAPGRCVTALVSNEASIGFLALEVQLLWGP